MRRTFFFLYLLVLLLEGAPAFANPFVDAFRQLKPLAPLDGHSQWRMLSLISLFRRNVPTFHPQGIKLIGNTLYLSTVEGHNTGLGHLLKFQLDSAEHPTLARIVDRLTFSPGSEHRLNHAGGLDGDENHLFLPLAGYRKEGPAQIVQVDLATLTYRSIAWVNDHLGTLVFGRDERQFHVFDWSTGMYSLPFSELNFRTEEPVRVPKHELADDWEYQDCKSVGDGYAICSAKSSGLLWPEGEIQLVRFDKAGGAPLEIVHRVPVPNLRSDGTPGGMRPLTYNAMDFSLVRSPANPESVTGMRFYFVPHDDEDSHLMVYEASLLPLQGQVARK